MRNRKKALITVLLVIMLSAIYTAVATVGGVQATSNVKTNLENVRDYSPAWSTTVADATLNYAIDGGYLYAGVPGQWRELEVPQGVIAGAVTVDPYHPTTLYLGAANEMAIYLSRDRGESWQRIPLSQQYIGGVTDLAINGAHRTLYVATDTAGIFRLRDVGSSMILSGHTFMDEPVFEVVADQLGAGLIFARTMWTVYHGVNNGQQWLPVDGLAATPTALAIANGRPAIVYIGTTDRGLLQSQDGLTWEVANSLLDGLLKVEAGSRVQVNALAVDPIQPDVIYVGMSYLMGHAAVHENPIGVAMSVDSGSTWETLTTQTDAAVAALMPVSGSAGAVFALTTQSRTPLALGNATFPTTVQASPERIALTGSGQSFWMVTLVSWLVAAAAAAALMWLLLQEWQRQPVLLPAKIAMH